MKQLHAIRVDKSRRYLYVVSDKSTIIAIDINLQLQSWFVAVVASVAGASVILIALPFVYFSVRAIRHQRAARKADQEFQALLIDNLEPAVYDSEHDVRISFQDIKFIKILNEGTQGVIFVAKYEGKNVAIKKIRRHEGEETFLRETIALQLLSHPNIVQFIGVVKQKEYLFVITELMDTSLEAYIHGEEAESITMQQKLKILMDVASGMNYMHNMENPVYHRDLKPSNILLDSERSNAKICDFGVSRMLSSSTLTGYVGTYVYMAPGKHL
jgi:tRNA A-37 threonylcarbamoyl transferase component Bud32